MKVSLTAMSAALFVLVGLFGEQVEGTDGTSSTVSGYFNWKFWSWEHNDKFYELYPDRNITRDDIENVLLGASDDFFLTAAQAYKPATESLDLVMRFDDCAFTQNATQDPSFWCPVDFTFGYPAGTIRPDMITQFTEISDMLKPQDYNRGVFVSNRYGHPLSDYIDGYLSKIPDSFWRDIEQVGMCSNIVCRGRSGGADPAENFAGVERPMADLEQEAMMHNATAHTATDAMNETASEGAADAGGAEEEETPEAEDSIESSASTMLSSLMSITFMVSIFWLF